MHQPYYKNLLTGVTDAPWVRLHGIKDYLDMVLMLEKFPAIRQVFNVVPSLLEQIEDYVNGNIKDRFIELTMLPVEQLTAGDKEFLLQRFFSISPEKCIAIHPRYYELFLKRKTKKEFTPQDYFDLQVWFNLAWFDPIFQESIPEVRALLAKGRFFNQEDKRVVIEKQIYVLKQIIPVYKKFLQSGQIEVTLSPYYHPILPLLYNTKTAKEANPKSVLPQINFSYPGDAKAQVDLAVKFYEERFGVKPSGMWPSEESVCQHILPFLIDAGIDWIVADEAILFKSLKLKKRNTELLYQPHLLERQEGQINIIFRDRNLSDMIGFSYHRWKTQDAVNDFMKHLENISVAFKNKDILLTVAMDGENAWEFYTNDGHDFLESFYQRLAEADFVKTTTVSEYLKTHPAKRKIKYLAAGSWIYGEFTKWIGSPKKNMAWEYLAIARKELGDTMTQGHKDAGINFELAWKQMYILEGSDWFWWYGDDDTGDFDKLFRMHLANFYNIIGKDPPDYVNHPL